MSTKSDIVLMAICQVYLRWLIATVIFLFHMILFKIVVLYKSFTYLLTYLHACYLPDKLFLNMLKS